MIEETLLEAEEKMDKAVEVAKEDFAAIRTGRANPGHVQQDHWSTTTARRRRCSSWPRSPSRTPAPSSSPRSTRRALRDIERAIRDSDLGVNPTNDGNVIRIAIPELTEERRKEYVKIAKAKAEDAKVSIRNIRRKAKETLDKLVKDGEVGEDEGTRAEKELDGLTKKHVDGIDELLKHKEAELLEV